MRKFISNRKYLTGSWENPRSVQELMECTRSWRHFPPAPGHEKTCAVILARGHEEIVHRFFLQTESVKGGGQRGMCRNQLSWAQSLTAYETDEVRYRVLGPKYFVDNSLSVRHLLEVLVKQEWTLHIKPSSCDQPRLWSCDHANVMSCERFGSTKMAQTRGRLSIIYVLFKFGTQKLYWSVYPLT